MGFCTGCFLTDIALVLATVITLLIFYIKWKYRYWERKGIPYLEPSMPFGNLKDTILQRKNLGILFVDFYYELKRKSKVGYGGIFTFLRPIFVPVDPMLIKRIMQTDFNHFMDRGLYINEKKDPLSANMFNLTGHRWKTLRAKLTPTFTTGKMKYMFQTLVDCSQNIAPNLEESIGESINIKDVVARYTVDVIGSCAFGLECNSFKDPNNDFLRWGKRVFDRTKFEAFRQLLTLAFPRLMLGLNVANNNPSVIEFYTSIVKETVKYRINNNVQRKDFMNLLITLKNAENLEEDSLNSVAAKGPVQKQNGLEDGQQSEGITMEQIIAQSFIFFIAGFETSSTTLTFCLFELTQNLNIQEKLRQEVTEVLEKHDGNITYESMMDMKYMGMCIDETLRKYPPLGVLNRVCTNDYIIPGTSIILNKGTQVQIPITAMHYDPEYYPDPQRFDPERFTAEMKQTRPDFTHIPFGDGPRVCIGLRFGMMQTKVGLTALIKNFRFTLSEKTKVPLKINPTAVITTAVGDIWLKVEKIV